MLFICFALRGFMLFVVLVLGGFVCDCCFCCFICVVCVLSILLACVWLFVLIMLFLLSVGVICGVLVHGRMWYVCIYKYILRCFVICFCGSLTGICCAF